MEAARVEPAQSIGLRRAQDKRQRRAEALPLVRLDRAPKANIVVDVLRPLDQQHREMAPVRIRQPAGGILELLLRLPQHPA